ncbi:thioredoxin domain-containing protein [bacterium]|nr:thioredoxin domain-containing protein [bacterium]
MEARRCALPAALVVLLLAGPGCGREELRGDAVRAGGSPAGENALTTTGQNRLAKETSPYLLQHADNPVDWYPWGEEAFAASRESGKPILLSIGYSSCHWCHVLEHESFEDDSTAALMNEHFICIKVDREERPDVDEIYMTAMQMMGLGGGWPLNAFLTPDRVPFYGGTYFPPDNRYGRPSWREVLTRVSDLWRDRRDDIVAQGSQILDALAQNAEPPPADAVPEVALLQDAVNGLLQGFDDVNGGFGGAPKFPRVPALELALAWHDRHGDARLLRMVEMSLRKMADGGIHDQLGGGFHRYSTDERWLVPHFEKMLYDNAQLARIYVEAYQVTGDAMYEAVTRKTLDYVLREMTEESGAFRSATDADSDGREGVYFVWTKPEIEELLGDDAPLFLRAYGVTQDGNFVDPHHPRVSGEPGMNVLHVAKNAAQLAAEDGVDVADVEARLADARGTLLERRATRTYPGMDDKVLTAWNGLMIGAMAYAGRALDEPRYVEAAWVAADFIQREMRGEDGRLLRTHRLGESRIDAFLEDYAYLADASLDLYEATFDLRWFEFATELAERMNTLFGDAEGGGWYHTAEDGEVLVARTRTGFDNATPSPNGIAAQVMARLAAMTGRDDYRTTAELAVRRFDSLLRRQPGGAVSLLRALDLLLHEDGEIVFAGKPTDEGMQRLIRPVHRAYLPGTVLALRSPEHPEAEELIPMLAGKTLVKKEEAVYVCRNFACQAPVTTVAEVERAVAGL